jgi:hypothetical protein
MPANNRNRNRNQRTQRPSASLTRRADAEAQKQMAAAGLQPADLLRHTPRRRELLQFHCKNCNKKW